MDEAEECFPLMRKVFGQSLCKGIVALAEGEVPAAYDDAVELLVHSLPRQVHESELAEGFVHSLPRSQPAHIVQSCIVVQSASAEALHAAAGLVGAFEHEHL